MMVFYYSIEVLATMTEFLILFSLIELHEPRKYPKRKQFMVKMALSTAMTLVVVAMNQISLFSYYTMLATILCVMFLGKILCNGTITQNFTICIILIMVMNIIDFSAANLITSLTTIKDFAQESAYTVGMQRTLWIITMKFVLIILFLAYRKYIFKIQLKKTKYLKWIVSIAILGFMCVAFLINSLLAGNITEMRNALIPAWLFMVGCLIVVSILFRMLYADEKKKHDYELVAMQAKYLQDNYQALINAQMDYEQNFHDLNNHLTALRSLVTTRKYEQAIAYIEKVGKPITIVQSLTRTGVEIVDAILNTKEQLAHNHGILVNIHADFPQDSNLEPADICAILSNLLDNAIEACDKIEGAEKRFIHFTCGSNNNIFTVKVENSVAENPFDRNKQLSTTKMNKRMHGVGLKSVASATEKYDGVFSRSCEDNVFTAIVSLNFTQ